MTTSGPEPTGRSAVDVEQLLRGAYEATDRLPIDDEPTSPQLRAVPAGRGRWRAPLLVAAAAALLVGGAVAVPGALRSGSGELSGTAGRDVPHSTPSAPTESWWTANGLVIEDARGGPRLCLGSVAWSDPPTCTGPRIVGWDWSAVSSAFASGVRWGHYVVVGSYAGGATRDDLGVFTLRRPATTPPSGGASPGPEAAPLPGPFNTPCREPAGGWVVDRTKTANADYQRLMTAVDTLPGLGDVWSDNRGGTVGTITNVSVVGDTAATERNLRRLWGGPLCVSPATHTRTQLTAIAKEVAARTSGALSWGPGFGGHVDLAVILDEDGRSQRAFDERYGTGLVRVRSVLQPYRTEDGSGTAPATSSIG